MDAARRIGWVAGIVLLICGSALADAPYGLDRRAPIGPFLDRHMPELGPTVSGNWSAEVAFPKLTFRNALGMAPIPGASRLVVWEREGRVWSFDDRQDASERKLMLDISRQCQGWDDCGLLGLAFHPNFAANHYVFVWYCWVEPGSVQGDPEHRPPTDRPNHNRLSRFTVGPDGSADPASERVLIDQQARVIWHKGGGMFFHPRDGMLYLSIGDDEDGTNSQRIDHSLLGGLLRIDVDCRGGAISHPIGKQPVGGKTAGYFIPNDNPFVGKPDALEEFYGIGLRSPHRMTHDAPSGRTFIGDVGEATREEIDVIEPTDPPGLNFQWPRIEGLQGDLTAPFLGVNKRPVIDYDHGQGNAVIGGYVYRGPMWADDLGGKYIFGDNGTGKVWALDERTAPPTKVLLCAMPFGAGPNSGSNYTGLSSFGLDTHNELYLCQMSSQGGHLFRLARTGPPPARKRFPRLLSQTGAFTDTARLTPAPGLIAYSVNSPLWSDGAVKSRWMALPAGSRIKFTPKGEWAFPDGTVFVKQFELPTDLAHPEVRRRLETRLLVRDASGSAYGVTYKWRPDNSDADLLDDSLSEPIEVRGPGGKPRTQVWYYPSQNDCMRCHTPAAGFVLGVKTRQINGAFDYPTAGGATRDNQLGAWSHAGLFDPPIDEKTIAGLDKLTNVADASAPIEARVRSYLDANCAHCHRPGGVPGRWDGRFDTPMGEAHIVGAPAINKLNIAGARLVKGGDPDRSMLLRRMSALDPETRMPPIARNVVDQRAGDVVRQWIAALPAAGQIPAGWSADDIGGVGVAGDSSFAGGAFTVSASGADVWDTADAFQFVSRPLHGDGSVTARVASIGEGDPWAKAGVMIRQDAQPDSPHAFMAITRDSGAAFQRRPVRGQGSEHTAGRVVHAPYWVRLTRAGNVVTGFVSPDGHAWEKVGEANIQLTGDVLVGLALTSHNNAALCAAKFEQVGVEAGHGPQ